MNYYLINSVKVLDKNLSNMGYMEKRNDENV